MPQNSFLTMSTHRSRSREEKLYSTNQHFCCGIIGNEDRAWCGKDRRDRRNLCQFRVENIDTWPFLIHSQDKELRSVKQNHFRTLTFICFEEYVFALVDCWLLIAKIRDKESCSSASYVVVFSSSFRLAGWRLTRKRFRPSATTW